MKQSMGRWVLGLAGLALIAGFFLPWVSVRFGTGLHIRTTGFDVATNMHHFTFDRLALFFVPLAGALVVLGALSNAQWLRRAALVSGGFILAYPTYKLVATFVSTTGFGLWMVFVAAFGAVFAALATRWDGR